MKVALIAIAKCEELYIEEWINYHLSMGFDEIIVADNDDELVLSKFASPKVIIEDYCGVEGVQPKAYQELFKKYRDEFDWIFFEDIDEFLVVEDGRNVKEFLSLFPSDVDCVRLNGKHYTDNDELDVIDDNYNVFDRFKTQVEVEQDKFFKTFVNTKIGLENPKIYGHGIYNIDLKCVNAKGCPCLHGKKSNKPFYGGAWYNHYRTKTIGEYIRQKCFRGGPNKNPKRYSNWQAYFKITNNLTQEKIDYAQKLIDDKNNPT